MEATGCNPTLKSDVVMGREDDDGVERHYVSLAAAASLLDPGDSVEGILST